VAAIAAIALASMSVHPKIEAQGAPAKPALETMP
jgi:hypothetical protein